MPGDLDQPSTSVGPVRGDRQRGQVGDDDELGTNDADPHLGGDQPRRGGVTHRVVRTVWSVFTVRARPNAIVCGSVGRVCNLARSVSSACSGMRADSRCLRPLTLAMNATQAASSSLNEAYCSPRLASVGDQVGLGELDSGLGPAAGCGARPLSRDTEVARSPLTHGRFPTRTLGQN